MIDLESATAHIRVTLDQADESLDAYDRWYLYKQLLVLSKDVEMKLRKEIIEKEGTGEFVHNGVEYKAAQGINRTIDDSALESIWDDLPQDDKDCINFKPKVQYAKLDEASILWDIITEKPATPTLTRLG